MTKYPLQALHDLILPVVLGAAKRLDKFGWYSQQYDRDAERRLMRLTLRQHKDHLCSKLDKPPTTITIRTIASALPVRSACNNAGLVVHYNCFFALLSFSHSKRAGLLAIV